MREMWNEKNKRNEWGNMKISIKYKYVALSAYIILVFPIVIFFFGWLKWYFSLLFSVVLMIGATKVYISDYRKREDTLDIPAYVLIFVAVFFAFWVLIAGNCGVSVSNFDTPWRRALLRDLIDYEWPVYYEKTSRYLVYYHVFFMIPALVGKLLGWYAALVAQAVWLWVIVFVSFLLISSFLKARETKVFILIAVMLVGWSGLNALGWILMQEINLSPGAFGLYSNEGYCDTLFNGECFNFLYRSNEDFLCEIFNQLPIWLAVPLMLEKRKIRNYAFIGILLLPYSPWGVLGIAMMMIVDAIYQLKYYLKEKQLKKIFEEIFSLPNICILASVGIVFGLYFSASSKLSTQGASFGILTFSKFNSPRVVGLLIFWLCEFGIYYIFLWKENRKDVLFKWSLLFLMVIPICWAGSIDVRDFCMNVSLPILYMLMIYTIKYVKNNIMGKVLNLKIFAFLVCLLIANTTPIFDWGNKIQLMVEQKKISIVNDGFYTFSDKIERQEDLSVNFLVEDIGKFKYIANYKK